MLLQQVLHSLGPSPPSSAVAPLAPSVVLGRCPLTGGTEAYSRQATKAGQSIVVALPRLQSVWVKKYHPEILPRKGIFAHVPMMTGQSCERESAEFEPWIWSVLNIFYKLTRISPHAFQFYSIVCITELIFHINIPRRPLQNKTKIQSILTQSSGARDKKELEEEVDRDSFSITLIFGANDRSLIKMLLLVVV